MLVDKTKSYTKDVDHINIWAKGQNFTNAILKLNGYKNPGIKFESGYIFSVSCSLEKTEEYDLEIEAQNEDFITIGSTFSKNGKSAVKMGLIGNNSQF